MDGSKPDKELNVPVTVTEKNVATIEDRVANMETEHKRLVTKLRKELAYFNQY